MEFRPCIDIHNGKVKQIVGSTLTDGLEMPAENFVSTQTSSFYSELYKQYNLKGGHIIKLGPNNDSAAISALKAWPDGLQIGGGINPNNAKQYLDVGASHVIVTSYVFKDGLVNLDNLKELVDSVGPNKLVLDLSCKKKDDEYYIVTDRWQKWTSVKINRETLELLGGYCDEILVHAASVEGKMMGPDLDLVKILAQFSPVPTTYAGGITTINDLEDIRDCGKNIINITVGSALDIFGGKLSFSEVINFCKNS
ncbi:MAG: phosphoribosylformimino-5-aminoimidazole carboxamide ribotide isomerase [Spirochaetaceae bacterium]